MANGVTNKDLYDAIGQLENKVVHRMELIESDVKKHDAWINQITGKFAILMVFIGLIINWGWDAIINRK